MSHLARDLIILIDSAVICNFTNNNRCFPFQRHVGHYTNKFTETGLNFFIKYVQRVI